MVSRVAPEACLLASLMNAFSPSKVSFVVGGVLGSLMLWSSLVASVGFKIPVSLEVFGSSFSGGGGEVFLVDRVGNSSSEFRLMNIALLRSSGFVVRDISQ